MTDSLVFGEPELVAGDEVGHEQPPEAAERFVSVLLATLEGDLLDTLAPEEHGDEAHVHHPEVHHAGLLETEGTVLVEDAHGYA